MTAQRQLAIRKEDGKGVGGGERWLWKMNDRCEESESLFPTRQKRRADDNLESEQRLSKRFNLLNLEHVGLYVPIRGKAPNDAPVATAQNDSMQLDNTKDKVYIHNLAAEIADLESHEETPLFLPDVEKNLSKIPRSVLMGRNPPIANNQMVLYNLPSSLSVPEEHNSVRRAIMDSRARARKKQAQDQDPEQDSKIWDSHTGNRIGHDPHDNGIANEEDMDVDENAMDIG